jgi:hypothetical protein
MIAAMALAVALVSTPVQTTWVWSLYEDADPLVLAQERPDTPDLQTTLECARGSGLVRLSLYGSGLGAGMAVPWSGDASAAVEASVAPDGAVVAPLRTDHPLFARFSETGSLSVVVGDHRQTVEVRAGDLAKLRRFADLCRG